MVSKMVSIDSVNDIPVITGQEYFELLAYAGADSQHAVLCERNMKIFPQRLEETVNAAYSITPDGVDPYSRPGNQRATCGNGGTSDAWGNDRLPSGKEGTSATLFTI